MATEKTTATLIRTLRLSDTSQIIHWCSGECGLLKTVAKGSLRPKSPFGGKLDLFFESEVIFLPSRTSDLHTLKETEVIHPRENIRKSYLSTLTAACFVRWVELVVERETAIPEIADLVRRALDYLCDEKPSLKAVRHFEKQLAQLTGIYQETGDSAEALSQAFGAIPAQRKDLLLKLEEFSHNDGSP